MSLRAWNEIAAALDVQSPGGFTTPNAADEDERIMPLSDEDEDGDEDEDEDKEDHV